jgi:hypothetical protein
MMPISKPTGGALMFQAFHTVTNRGETDKALIILAKMSAVLPFHRFGEKLTRNFRWDGQPIKIPKASIPQNHETAKQTAFYSELSITCLFQTV